MEFQVQPQLFSMTKSEIRGRESPLSIGASGPQLEPKTAEDRILIHYATEQRLGQGATASVASTDEQDPRGTSYGDNS